MEHLEIVNEFTGELLGVTLPRPDAIAQQAWCQSTNIYVLNSEGKVLCHQRSLDKERMPGFWMTHLGGHVGVGESFDSNAVKELEEEAGVTVDPAHVIHWRTTRIPKARLWTKEYVVIVDKAHHEFTPQPGEVEKFEWKTPEEILDEAKNKGNWCAGTHDFLVEYHCLRAALTVAHHHGSKTVPKHATVWHQIQQPQHNGPQGPHSVN